MRARPFSDESLGRLLTFLAASHPRARAHSIWGGLPEAIQRRVASFVLEPLCMEFVRWDPMSVVRSQNRSLSFGLRLRRRCAMPLHIANDEGVAVCGPPLEPQSGLYEVEFSVAEVFSMDGFCRADIGVVADPANPHRNGSGIWWEAGDGDVYVASDMEAVTHDGKPGWLGDDSRVEVGLLPRWDRPGAVGLVVDTLSQRLSFTQDGQVLPFEMVLPASTTLYFAVGWSGDTFGTLRVGRLQRFLPETQGPLGRLLASLRSSPSAASAAVEVYMQRAPGSVSADAVAEAVDAMPADSKQRAAVVAGFSRALRSSGEFSSAFAVSAVRSLRVRSAQERLAVDLAGHVSDPQSYESTVLAGALPGLSSSKRAQVVSRLRWARMACWVRSFCWCCW